MVPVSPETGDTPIGAHPYSGTVPLLGRAALDLLGSPCDSTFIDLGCGKGRMLALAAERGFSQSIGVELDASLVAIARRNLGDARIRGGRRLSEAATVLNQDARRFDFPDTPLAIYLNNPFGVPILSVVLERLGASLAANPRTATVVLQRRVIEDPSDDSPTAELLADTLFLSGGPARPSRMVTRFLLRGYALWKFTS